MTEIENADQSVKNVKFDLDFAENNNNDCNKNLLENENEGDDLLFRQIVIGQADAEYVMDTPNRKISKLQFSDQTRFVILLMCTVCIALTISNSMALNFTIICMQPDPNTQSELNSTTVSTYNYTTQQRGLLFSAIAIGAILGTQPVVWMTSRFGGRITFTAFGMLSAISTLLCPLAASWSFEMLFIMRVFQGFAVAFSFPSVGSISAEWTSLEQTGMFIALMSCYIQLGPIFTMPVAGALCVSSFGWPAVFYLQGGLTLIAFVVFYAFYRDSPRFHRNVSDKELGRIEKGRITVHSVSRRAPVPYLEICKSWPILGVWLSAIGGNLGFQIFCQYGPIYLNKVLGYDVENTGFASALPFVASLIIKVLAGPLSDNAKCVSEKTRLMMFAGVSQGVMTACILALALLPPSRFLGQIFYTAAVGFSGLNCVGVVKCAQLVARQHVHFVMAIMALIMWVMVLILPVIVGFFAPDNTPEQWSVLFCVISGVVIVTIIGFFMTADSKPASFTIDKPKKASIPADLKVENLQNDS